MTLDASTTVTASFTQQFFNLTVTASGPGTVTSSPSGITCGTACVAGFAPGTTVTLTAAASAGATFSGWGGACSGSTTSCTVAMTAFKTVTATFTTISGGSFTDNPLVANSTRVKAIHVTELRVAIDQVRARRALTPIAWVDPVITQGATPVKAVHVMQMRSALTQVYQAAGITPPSFADPSLTSFATLVRAVHLNELRAAVLAAP